MQDMPSIGQTLSFFGANAAADLFPATPQALHAEDIVSSDSGSEGALHLTEWAAILWQLAGSVEDGLIKEFDADAKVNPAKSHPRSPQYWHKLPSLILDCATLTQHYMASSSMGPNRSATSIHISSTRRCVVCDSVACDSTA